MAIELHTERQQAHSLLDALPEEKVAAVRGVLEVMVDPRSRIARALANAPLDDEELTPEMIVELQQAEASIGRGNGTPHAEILHEFDL